MSLRRVLITGGGGQLASDLEELLAGRATTPGREALDITDDDAVRRHFHEVRPEVVFNCAAFHNVEVCEREEDRSFAVNARAVKRLAERCAGGREAGAYEHELRVRRDCQRALPGARGAVPAQRLRAVEGRRRVRGARVRTDALVARTAGLYGLHGSASKGGNFVTRTIGRAREQGQLKMVADQRLSPTYTADLAEALLEAVEQGAAGLVHLTSSSACSWYEFTQAIVELAGIEADIEPVATTRPPGGADRPLNGVLARPRADASGLTPLRHWRDGLEAYMRRAQLSVAPASKTVGEPGPGGPSAGARARASRTVAVAFHEPVVGGAEVAVLRVLPLLEAKGWRFVFWVPGPGPCTTSSWRVATRSVGSLANFATAGRRCGCPGPAREAAKRSGLSAPLSPLGGESVARDRPREHAHHDPGSDCGPADRVPVLMYVHEMLPKGGRGAVAARLIRSSVDTVISNTAACVESLTSRKVRTEHHAYYGIESRAAPQHRDGDRPLVVGTLGVVSRRAAAISSSPRPSAYTSSALTSSSG